jgi:lipopolysaccharide export system protein LptA
VLDMAQDLVTMTGNVVITQGPNVVRGDRLVINLATKQGRMEGGRVQTLITPSGGQPRTQ